MRSSAAVLLVFLLTGCSAPGGAEEVGLNLLFEDDTIYAPGYSDERFNSIAVGMTDEEVLRRLGIPIDDPWHPQRASTDWDTGMRWSRSAHDSHYKVRVVLFRNGTVVEKHAEFYVD